MAASRLSCLVLVVAIMAGGGAEAEPPPLEVYAALPAAVLPRLSPDGSALAMIADVGGQQALVVRRLADMRSTILAAGEFFPNWVLWKSDGRLLASVRFKSERFGYDAVNETRLAFFDPDGKEVVPARLAEELAMGAKLVYARVHNQVPQYQDRLVSLLPDDPDKVLVAVTPSNDFFHEEVRRVDVHNGHGSTDIGHVGQAIQWFADARGALRGVVQLDRNGAFGDLTRQTVLVRGGAEGEWQPIERGVINQDRRFQPVGFSADAPDLFYLLVDGAAGRLEARAYDTARNEMREPALSDPGCDVEAIRRDTLVVGFLAPCRPDGLHYLDSGWQNDWDAIRKALKLDYVRLLDRTKDGKRVLAVSRGGPNAPNDYWLLDRTGAPTQLKPLGSAYPKLPADQIAEMRPVVYTARDGMPIPAWLTLPVGYKEGRIPFVVLPHDGPAGQDERVFNWVAQYLASRGYGVLQPQYRGSTGHGTSFERAGYQQWGLAIQDDITDGTRWAVEHQFADPRRICIVGAGFGGYAALMGAVREPGTYACVAGFGTIADLGRLAEDIHHTTRRDINLPRLKGADQSLDDISPVDNAAKITVPVLLVHGRKDAAVPVEHTESMERALKRSGKSVETVYLDDANHALASDSARLAWLTALDRFLAANIGRDKQGL